jgi:3-deoxy-manno-octulosonate cytidylyltransferase (CMP-KDO synthetase)
MSLPTNPLLLIPARMQAARLPGKPLADIAGLPMVVHVMKRAQESGLGRVVVAAAEKEIADAVSAAGGEAVLTDPALPTGSDRIYQALQRLDAQEKVDAIINVQGDVPTLNPADLRATFALLENPEVDIATAVSILRDEKDIAAPQIVKAVVEMPEGGRKGRALYFTRGSAPYGKGPFYGHVGLYAYRRKALERFVREKPGVVENREKLEQLRALALGLRIEAVLVDSFPLGVDTPEDLEKARTILGRKL